jgi:uncharacterized RDD family membrane protein YckC
VVVLILIIVLMVVGLSLDAVFREMGSRDSEGANRALWYLSGVMMLVWGFGSFLYFTLCELLLRGQTIGKRMTSIRVAKADGFQLDTVSIVVRNLFRILDQLPPMWIIPFVSQRSQRSGDLVAGTLVVSDAPAELSPVRAALAKRSTADAQFRFDQARLRQISSDDFLAIERVLDRWPDLSAEQQEQLLAAYTLPVAKKLGFEPPPPSERLRFLEDLFSAELRRRERKLV